jgi:hypothetical protein
MEKQKCLSCEEFLDINSMINVEDSECSDCFGNSGLVCCYCDYICWCEDKTNHSYPEDLGIKTITGLSSFLGLILLLFFVFILFEAFIFFGIFS